MLALLMKNSSNFYLISKFFFNTTIIYRLFQPQ